MKFSKISLADKLNINRIRPEAYEKSRRVLVKTAASFLLLCKSYG